MLNPDIRQTLSDLLDLSSSACGFRGLAVVRKDNSAEPVIHPPELHGELHPYVRTALEKTNGTTRKLVHLDSVDVGNDCGAGQSCIAPSTPESHKALNLFGRNGEHQGVLIGLGANPDSTDEQHEATLSRIARLTEKHLEQAGKKDFDRDDLEQSFIINRAILNTLYDAVVMTNLEGRIQSANPAMVKLFGYPENDLIGEPITKLMPPEMADKHPHFMRAYAKGETSGQIMGNLRAVDGVRADGSRFTLQIAVTETTVNSERLLVAAMQDITEGEKARIHLERFQKTLDSTLDCVFMFDADSLQFFYVNQGAVDQLGYTRKELLALHPFDIKPLLPETQFREMVAPLANGDVRQLSFQTLHRRKDGRDIPVDVLLQYVSLEGDPPRFIAVVRDVSEYKRQQEEIEQLAYFDPLTKLPNRSLIHDRLENLIQQCSETGRFAAVMLTDLDDFKSVNDTLGHRNGDKLLIEISERFAAALGSDDSVSRLGGDEFLVVLGTEDTDRKAATETIFQTAGKLLAAASDPTATLGHSRPVSTSIGVVLFNDASVSSSELMRRADIAMYDAKQKGKNHYSLFDDRMQKQLVEEQQLAADLNRALSSGDEIVPWFQPKVDAQGKFNGFEALARWNHPQRGLLNPGCFIDLAEKKNLMTPMTDQIVHKACQTMSQWRQTFAIDDFSLSVNISQSQLARYDYPNKLQQILADTGLPSDALILEVTESTVAENIDESIKQMQRLKAIGVRFSLDDFGTGYSSLSYLRQLPIDELKIDRSFIASLLDDEESRAIVQVIMLLSDSLKLSVVAEGIEDPAQWQVLTQLGCTCFQGYYFCHPEPPEAILQRLQGLKP